MRLSPHFTLEELISSQTALRRGIDNTPNTDIVSNLRWGCIHVLEPVRALLAHPMFITSGYRSIPLNAAIGGSINSQHCLGEAADFKCPGHGTPRDCCVAIERSGIDFDQLIYEGRWVHISWRRENQRKKIMTAQFFGDGQVRYIGGIV